MISPKRRVIESSHHLKSQQYEEDYSEKQILGKGSFGIVYKSSLNGETSALKVIQLNSKERRESAKTEIEALQTLKHQNIVSLYEFKNYETHVALQLEYVPNKLRKLIPTICQNTNQVRQIGFQLIKALTYIHNSGFIHQDVKPSNILVSNEMEVKLADFGQCMRVDDVEKKKNYVVTRWYRAPELLLGTSEYGTEIDVWSLGCILYELATGSPLYPGHNTRHQFILVMHGAGDMNFDELLQCPLWSSWKSSIITSPTNKVCKNIKDPLLNDLILRCLQLNPSERIKMVDALNHKFFSPCLKGQSVRTMV